MLHETANIQPIIAANIEQEGASKRFKKPIRFDLKVPSNLKILILLF